MKIRQTSALAFAAAAIACAPEADEGPFVARVGDYQFTVDQVVDLLVDEERLGNDAEVIGSLAGFWADYTLLAEAASEDTTFADIDFGPLIEQTLWLQMVSALRDSSMQVDTFITEDELESMYAEEAPAERVRARHIMITYPLQAAQPQRDSVRMFVESLRERIAAGESFEELADRFSHDRATASLGGDLGYFGRGDMVAPFEEAVMALPVGGLSEVVETPLGLHIIRLDDREVQGFDQIAVAYRQQVQARRVAVAESIFVTAIEDRVGPMVEEGAAEVVRGIATDPGTRLSRRAAGRALVSWEGGAVSVGDVQAILRVEGPALSGQLAIEEDDERVNLFLQDLARRELLLDEARSAGLEPPRDELDALSEDASAQLREAADMLGLLHLDQAPGEPIEIAITRAVEEALQDNLSGASRFVPLGAVSYQLRERSSFELDDAGIGQAIIRITQLRATRGLSPLEEALDAPDTPADTINP